MTINATTSQPVTPAEPVTRAQLLRIVADAIEIDGMPAPHTVTLADHEALGEMHLTLRMGGFPGDADAVATWANYLGGPVAISHLYDEDSPRPWRVQEVGDSVNSPVKWHGWGVRVWASVIEPQDGDR